VPVADSSWVVALLYPDDIHHKEAWWAFVEAGEVLVPELVVGESFSVLSYRYTRRELAEIGEAFLESVRVVETNLREGLEFHRKLKGPKISWVDSIVIMHALRLGEPLLSFDEKQIKVWERLQRKGGKAGQRRF